jgi:hypothetical protein
MAKKAAVNKVPKPVLHQCATLGSLMGYGGKNGEWSIDEKIKKIRDAGFTGFVGRTAFVSPEQVAQSGLLFACTTDLGGIGEIKPKLRAIKAAGARVVNVQMLDHDTPTKRALEVARRLMATADEMEMDVSIEVHRDTCTETPEKAYALAEGFEKAEKKKLKMTWDFSHPAVIKHLSPPYWDRLAERPDLIQFANQQHFRPFNGQHAQIPALDAKGNFTPEFLDWLVFAERVLACWLEAAEPGRELFVCPEQIGGGYYVSVYGDRWKDVLAIQKEIDRVWKKLLRKWVPPKKK